MSVIIDEETLEALEARGFSVVLTDGRREVRVERGMTVEELPRLNERPPATAEEHLVTGALSSYALHPTDTPGIYLAEYGFPVVAAEGPYTPPAEGEGRISDDYLEYLSGKS